VALQVGHWQHEKLPKELRWIGRSAGGASADGAVEWQVSLAIARAAQRRLQAAGLAVDLVAVTVPSGYRAAAFVSIHADGNGDPTVTGFKVAPSARDRSGLSRALNDSLARRYAERTGLSWNTSITPDMTNYYAFDARRFRHAINTETPAVVLETGFLTNPEDRRVIVDAPQLAAEGIANGVLDFLRQRVPDR
jgi:N-acetylmuramoyl-L-alanine amidase